MKKTAKICRMTGILTAVTICTAACGKAGGGEESELTEDSQAEKDQAEEFIEEKSVTEETGESEFKANSEERSDLKAAEYTFEADTEWKRAYADFLSDAVENQTLDEPVEGYWLYDIDKNMVPELIVKYGGSEADYHGIVYTWKDGKILETERIGLGHSSLYAVPGNGLIIYWGHMGYGEAQLYTMDETTQELYSEKELFAVDLNEAYNQSIQSDPDADWPEWPEPKDYVDGAFWMNYFDPNCLIPISDYEEMEEYRRTPVSTAEQKNALVSEGERTFADSILETDGKVYAVAADRFVNELGEIAVSQLFQKELLSGYSFDYGKKLKIRRCFSADLNGDHEEEVIWYLGGDEEESRIDYQVILHRDRDNDVVYAYVSWEYGHQDVWKSGVIAYIDDYACRVLFDKDEFAEYTIGIVD